MWLAVLLCALCWVLWKYLSKRKGMMNLPPLAAGGLPIVGHTFLVLANREQLYHLVTEVMLGTSLKQGIEAVNIRVGTLDFFVFMDPDDCFLLASCIKKDRAYDYLKPLFGETGLLTADIPLWKKHRKILNPTFNQKVLDNFLVEFNTQSRQFVTERLALKDGKGFFNQMPYVKYFMYKLVCVTLMGIDADEKSLRDEAKRANKEYTDCIIQRLRKFWYHSDFIFGLSNLKKKQDSAAAAVHEVCDKVIRRKKAERLALKENATELQDESKPQFRAFIDLLLDLAEEGVLTDREIREEVITFIGAGFDTTSLAMAFTLLNVGSYPRVQKKLYDELQEVFKGSDRDVERQDLSMLKYLEAVIKEAMRLYPTIITVGRCLDKDLKFKNYSLPAGSRCFMSIYHLGRHSMWGPDAEKFRPERWLDGSVPDNTNAFAAFGLGKRSCIGHNYAMMSLKTTLAHVLRRYHVTGDVTKLVQNIDLVVRLVSGHHISIESRQPIEEQEGVTH